MAEPLKQTRTFPLLSGLARGLTADVVGGPVDLATILVNSGLAAYGYAGNKLGLLKPSEMPDLIEKPVGGSDWFAGKSSPLTDDGSARFMAGRLTGNIAPGIGKTAAKVPVQRDSSPNALVWHGSPHKFDKFDSSKIGTGEGAQAYGHGLYLAESPKVAESYKKNLSFKDAVREFRKELPDDADFDEVLDFAGSGALDPQKANVIKQLAANDWLGFDYPSQAISAAFRDLKNFDASPELLNAIENYGNLYKVDLPDAQIAKMLDWDKPLSAQMPSVQTGLAQSEAVRAYMANAEAQRLQLNARHPDRLTKIPGATKPYDATRMAGRDAYSALSQEYGNHRLVAERLNGLGIPGIRYLDGSSRNLGEGTSNFVIHPGNESFLQILERNGLPLPLMKGLAGK